MTDDWKKEAQRFSIWTARSFPGIRNMFFLFCGEAPSLETLADFLFLACIPLYILRIWDENRMKRAYLMYLWGLPAETVREYGRKFAEMAQEWIYPELKERLAEYRKKGYLCLMVSASPSFT